MNEKSKFYLCVCVALGGCVAAEPSPEATPPPIASTATERLALASLESIDMAFPDEAGTLHKGVVVVSRDIARQAEDLLRGARAILKTDKRDKVAGAAQMTYEQRTETASTAVAAAASSSHTALLAVVFEEDSVVGWRGTMRAAADSGGPVGTQGGRTYNDWITTTDSALVKPSASYYCPAGAGAHGFLNAFSTTSTTVRLFYNAPYPLGTQIYWDALLFNGGPTTYNWPNTYFGSWYYVTSSQTPTNPPQGLTTGVTSSIDCYWYGL